MDTKLILANTESIFESGKIKCGMHKGFILRSPLFLLSMNNLSQALPKYLNMS